MSFALTKFAAYGTNIQSVSSKRGIQVAELTITAANTDIDLDIGDLSPGTFWTAVAGALATKAQELLATIVANSRELVAVRGTAFLDRLKTAAAAGANEYAIAVSVKLPNITWHSGDAPTSYVVQLEWLLSDGAFPTVAELST